MRIFFEIPVVLIMLILFLKWYVLNDERFYTCTPKASEYRWIITVHQRSFGFKQLNQVLVKETHSLKFEKYSKKVFQRSDANNF